MKIFNKKDFEQACNESKSMAEACSKLGLHFGTFRKHAKIFGCYRPNQSGKGIKKNIKPHFPLEDIIHKNLQPQYCTGNLKHRLIKEGVKKYSCENCGLEKWLNKPIPLELNHKDGNRFNHNLTNLELLCPNCHALTPNYRGKNKKKKETKIKILQKRGRKPKKEIKKTRSLEEYYKDRENKLLDTNKEKIDLIKNSNINWSERGWRLEISKLISCSPQRSGTWLKKYLPEIWEKAWKHKS